MRWIGYALRVGVVLTPLLVPAADIAHPLPPSPDSSPALARPGPPPDDATCAAGALRVVAVGAQGASGTDYSLLRFELRRPGDCTLSGYPGVTLLNGRHRLNIHVGRLNDGLPSRTLHVDARHPAYFDFVFRSYIAVNGNPDGRLCRTKITGLSIIPPNDGRALTVRLRREPFSVCSGSVAVEAVRSART
jgi:hypothetical protein